MNKNNITIVENIRVIASQCGTNISKIEKACGFANGTIGKWAKAPKSPPFDKIFKVAEHLGVMLEDIVGDDCKFLTDTPETKKDTTLAGDVEFSLDAELIKRLIQLTPEEATKVDAFVQGILANRST